MVPPKRSFLTPSPLSGGFCSLQSRAFQASASKSPYAKNLKRLIGREPLSLLAQSFCLETQKRKTLELRKTQVLKILTIDKNLFYQTLQLVFLDSIFAPMKNFETQKSRLPIPIRCQRNDSLSERRTILHNLLISLLLIMPAFVLIYSCRKDPSSTPIVEEVQVVDSTLTTIYIRNASAYPVKDLQVLIYKNSGTQSLETKLDFAEIPDTIEVVTTEGEKHIAVVANCPKSLSTVALSRYDALAGLGYDFNDEDLEYPIVSGYCLTQGQIGEVDLTSLMCQVEISAISNSMDNYELVESPKIRLVDINSYAYVMQESGFYPTELIDYGEWSELPYDIGLFTQYPGTTVYCYPNETSEEILGSIFTYLELECLINNSTCNFYIQLPAFGRNSKIEVELTIHGSNSFDNTVRVVNEFS